jgi:hypothetical protein
MGREATVGLNVEGRPLLNVDTFRYLVCSCKPFIEVKYTCSAIFFLVTVEIGIW